MSRRREAAARRAARRFRRQPRRAGGAAGAAKNAVSSSYPPPSISDPRVLRLVTHYVRRSVEGGGHEWSDTQGIALGCPLSPVLGAFLLYALDGT